MVQRINFSTNELLCQSPGLSLFKVLAPLRVVRIGGVSDFDVPFDGHTRQVE